MEVFPLTESEQALLREVWETGELPLDHDQADMKSLVKNGLLDLETRWVVTETGADILTEQTA